MPVRAGRRSWTGSKAIDVAKDSGMVCVRVPHQTRPGKRDMRVWSVPARTNSIIALADQLAEQGIQRVVLESTSDCWRSLYYLLDARGLTVWLVNARDVKHVTWHASLVTAGCEAQGK